MIRSNRDIFCLQPKSKAAQVCVGGRAYEEKPMVGASGVRNIEGCKISFSNLLCKNHIDLMSEILYDNL